MTGVATENCLGFNEQIQQGPAKGGLTPGLQVYMGRSVVLDTGKVQIVLLSRHIEPTAQEMLQVLGIDPSRKKYVAIKSRVHWRADLGSLRVVDRRCRRTRRGKRGSGKREEKHTRRKPCTWYRRQDACSVRLRWRIRRWPAWP